MTTSQDYRHLDDHTKHITDIFYLFRGFHQAQLHFTNIYNRYESKDEGSANGHEVPARQTPNHNPWAQILPESLCFPFYLLFKVSSASNNLLMWLTHLCLVKLFTWLLKMTTAQVVETSIRNNSLSQDYPHPDNNAKHIRNCKLCSTWIWYIKQLVVRYTCSIWIRAITLRNEATSSQGEERKCGRGQGREKRYCIWRIWTHDLPSEL